MKHLTLALGIVVAGCNFNVAGDKNVSGGGDDLSLPGDDFGDVDLAGGGGGDMSMPPDIAGLPIVCTAGATSCNGSTLVTCPDGTAQLMTTCALGCSTTGGAHCEVMYPRAPVTRADFDTTGLTPINITAGGGISTDNGLIGAANTPFRHANTDANTYEVHDGIGFHAVTIPGQATKLGIYTFKSLTLAQGQTLTAYGTNGLALVSAGDATIDGIVDVTCAGNVFLAGLGGAANAKPYLSGPGGGNGGQPGNNNDGVSIGNNGGGSGATNSHQGGGGGGAFADVGGDGGAEGGNKGGGGGKAYGDAMLTTLLGGSGGGAGGQGGLVGSQPYGGGGGGVAMLVVQGTLTLGSGTAVGGVNTGGCGGIAALGVGGGGGGAGGTILIQAISVHVAANGAVASNGGGGAASNVGAGATSNGHAGALSTTPSGGGTGGSAAGGNGGAQADSKGQPGGDSAAAGAGAGGAAGRIRIDT